MVRVPVDALGAEGQHHLRTVHANTTYDIAQKTFSGPLDLFDLLQGAIRIIEDLQESDSQRPRCLPKFQLPDVGELA